MKANELWSITARDINPKDYFGAMSANGMIGIVSDYHPMKTKEIILNGVFDRYKRGRVSNILQGINPLDIDLIVNGELISLENITNYQQTLSMRNAELITTFNHGRHVHVTHTVKALRNLPYSLLTTLTIEVKKESSVTVINNITAPDHLREVSHHYSQIDRPHVMIPLLTTQAKSPSGQLTLAASNSYIFQEDHGSEPELIHEDWDFNRHLLKFNKTISKGESYTFGIVSSLCTSVHFSDVMNEAERLCIYAKLQGINKLNDLHNQAWNKLWEGDIQIDGDRQAQQEVRLMIYYLYASVREGSRLSLSPVGLSGLGYNGHVFWDTELWMYPALLVLNSSLAKSLLDYRLDRLKAAQDNAFSHGFDGAMYPWESADDGTEQTPVWALTGPFQQHISACISWSFWQYYLVTQDIDFLRNEAYPIIKEVAKFWCSRVERTTEEEFSINNVIGANEFEENIDNNAFTNALVKQVLKNTIKAAILLGESPDPDWHHVAERIKIVYFEDGVTRENESYEGAEIKQADVNLLAHPLNYYTDPEQILKDLEYYRPRMSPDGPAMGFSTLATIEAKYGDPNRAYTDWVNSYRDNAVGPFGVMSECSGGRGISPYFTTGAGGALQTLLFGFGGIEISDTGIAQKAVKIPKQLKGIKIKLSNNKSG